MAISVRSPSLRRPSGRRRAAPSLFRRFRVALAYSQRKRHAATAKAATPQANTYRAEPQK